MRPGAIDYAHTGQLQPVQIVQSLKHNLWLPLCGRHYIDTVNGCVKGLVGRVRVETEFGNVTQSQRHPSIIKCGYQSIRPGRVFIQECDFHLRHHAKITKRAAVVYEQDKMLER